MSGDSDADKVPNQYLAVLKSARPQADDRGATLRSALNKASVALESGAWLSTTATQFGATLGDQRSALQPVGDRERDLIDAEVQIQAKEPTVPPDDYRAKFSYYAHHLGPS
ncbi:hypothetical protein D9V37_19080 [Nocardioides mangrovicus]|uniref:ESX-1 secretion-associated protein n=1 Tax=Nocardioides mangrovicus TaxID=2478913 RepID=A0A3L8NY84_9ACTN|nr:hypothetical protein [Nocardioides mangrovicus]RLV48176.1 hypothetical protein D9V37_19080 [Nocardioides mangrovicus]